MTETKSIFASKTVWGAATAIIGSAVALLGLPLSDTDQGAIVELLSQAATLAGAAVALWGRISATRRLRG